MTIISIPSPNHHARTMRPTHIVMHIAEGTLAGCDAWLTNPQSNASAHYCVGKDGTIHQYVDESAAAWANGAVREPRIPLPSDANPNEWTISIEHEGHTGEPWTPEMYQADAWLLRGISERWGIPLDREHIIGHCDLDSVTRPNCPGTGLDFDRLLREAKGVSMNATLAKLLAEHPNLTRRGVHGTGNAYDSADYYVSQVSEMADCRVSWVKLVVAGDSGVNACRELVDCGLIPIVRPYDTSCPRNVIDPGFLKPYRDAGVVIFESPFNEFYYDFENAWGSTRTMGAASVPTIGGEQPGEIRKADLSRMSWPLRDTRTINAAGMPADWPAQVANGWNQFARIVLDAGGVPTTPSVEGWRYETIFRPMIAALDPALLKESIVAMHNRPLNHPIDYDKDTGCWLAWKDFDAAVQDVLGVPVPLLATEAGPEPGWSMDPTYPAITPQMHADMVRDILAYPTPSHYLGDCFWLWQGSGAWAGASWKRNSQHMQSADLPVVQMLKEWQPDVPEPDFPPDEPDALSPEDARDIGWRALGVPLNPGAAFFRYAQAHNLGYPLTPEWDERGYRFQAFSGGLVYAPVGQWDLTTHVSWT